MGMTLQPYVQYVWTAIFWRMKQKGERWDFFFHHQDLLNLDELRSTKDLKSSAESPMLDSLMSNSGGKVINLFLALRAFLRLPLKIWSINFSNENKNLIKIGRKNYWKSRILTKNRSKIDQILVKSSSKYLKIVSFRTFTNKRRKTTLKWKSSKREIA